MEHQKYNYNLIDKNGNLLFDASVGWVDMVYGYHCDRAAIHSDKKGTNYIDKSGNIISERWYTIGYEFVNNYAPVALKDNGTYCWNYLKKDGKILSKDEWFKGVKDFDEDGTAGVQRFSELWNFITTDGKFTSDEWADTIIRKK